MVKNMKRKKNIKIVSSWANSVTREQLRKTTEAQNYAARADVAFLSGCINSLMQAAFMAGWDTRGEK